MHARRSRCARRRNGTTRASRRSAADATLADLAGGARTAGSCSRSIPRAAARCTRASSRSSGIGRRADRALPRDVRAAAKPHDARDARRRACRAARAAPARRHRATMTRLGTRRRRSSPRSTPATCSTPRAPATLIAGAFPEDDVRVFKRARRQLRLLLLARARRNALRIAGRAEVESILAERRQVEVDVRVLQPRYMFARPGARGVRRRRELRADRYLHRCVLRPLRP